MEEEIKISDEALENGEKLSEEEKIEIEKEAVNLEDVIEEEKVDEPKEQPEIPSGETDPDPIPQSILSEEPKTYQGKKIIAEKTSVINEKEYITLTLEDGTTCQLSEGEYKNGVK